MDGLTDARVKDKVSSENLMKEEEVKGWGGGWV